MGFVMGFVMRWRNILKTNPKIYFLLLEELARWFRTAAQEQVVDLDLLRQGDDQIAVNCDNDFGIDLPVFVVNFSRLSPVRFGLLSCSLEHLSLDFSVGQELHDPIGVVGGDEVSIRVFVRAKLAAPAPSEEGEKTNWVVWWVGRVWVVVAISARSLAHLSATNFP